MNALITFIIGICFFLATPSVEAWNASGHRVSAAIAYSDLKERNPEVLAKAIEILNEHPEVTAKWADKLESAPPNDRDLYLFMLAAVWPDNIRKTKYGHPEWHYVNIPYRPGKAGITIPEDDSIITAFSENQSIVQSTTSTAQERVKALCWMLHLIGDIHQPLHSTKLVTEQFPEPIGDKGGNLFLVRYSPGNPTVKLHQLWDDLILKSTKFQAARNKSIKLRSRPDVSRDNFAEQLAVVDFTDWAKASHKIAIEHVYLNGTLKPSTNEHDGVVPTDYQRNSAEIASRLIVLAGYRISDSMVDILGQ